MPTDRILGQHEGSKVDLTLKSVSTLQLSGAIPFLGIDTRITPPTQIIDPAPLPHDPVLRKSGVGWVLFSGFYLLQTAEHLNMPYWLIGSIKERTTIFRDGAICRVTDADPGYHGAITCALYLPPRSQLVIEQGARFLSIRFEPIVSMVFWDDGTPDTYELAEKEEVDIYGGIWSGDKRSTEGQAERGF